MFPVDIIVVGVVVVSIEVICPCYFIVIFVLVVVFWTFFAKRGAEQHYMFSEARPNHFNINSLVGQPAQWRLSASSSKDII